MRALNEQAIQTMLRLTDKMYSLYHETDSENTERCFTGLGEHDYDSFPGLVQSVECELFHELWKWGYLYIVDRKVDGERQITQYALTEVGKLTLNAVQNPNRRQRSLSRQGKAILNNLVSGYPLQVIESDRSDAGYKWKAQVRDVAVSDAVLVTLLQNDWIEMPSIPERTITQPRGWQYTFRISLAGCRAFQKWDELLRSKASTGLKKLPQNRHEEEQIKALTQKVVALIIEEIGIEKNLAQNRAYLRVLFRAVRRRYTHEHLAHMTSKEGSEATP